MFIMIVFVSFELSLSPTYSNREGSALIGTKPSRCAKISSATTLVLFTTKTFSIAIVGTSANIIRRNAFAKAGEHPSSSNTHVSSSLEIIFNANVSRKPSTLNAQSFPKDAYAPPYAISFAFAFVFAPAVTNLRCSSNRASMASICAVTPRTSAGSALAARGMMNSKFHELTRRARHARRRLRAFDDACARKGYRSQRSRRRMRSLVATRAR
mmetsp:Transcript_4640/g.16950  ORF Transcript_4640/g.16950 Transcript_4640/m.16950 type:complete len:212 (-) Transcript_4640:9-644(-)